MDAKQILLKYWGYSQFRPLQEDIISSVLKGNDAMGLMPTGGGKSICYQVPGLVMDGICIVVSPLIALMKDQVEALKNRGIKAIMISSAMNKHEIDVAFDNCIYGNIKFLYISPERLETGLARERISRMKVCLIAVDEAHCISHWGFDFRPSYRNIIRLRDWHPKVPLLALTATATTKVLDDILAQLKIDKVNVHRISFERKNIAYQVIRCDDKMAKLVKLIKTYGGSTIVYARNRKRTQEIVQILHMEKISSDYYHAGIPSQLRSQKQDDWMKRKFQVIVATNAFGMGIDKEDVRLVVHLDLPDSPEAYFQEAGRAGRDGKDAGAVILYNQSDLDSLQENLELNYPPLSEIRKTYQALANYLQLAIGSGKNMVYDFDLHEFCKRFALSPLQAYSSLKILEQEGYFALSDAIHSPSRIHFLINKDNLYKFQVEHSNHDAFIKLLLRSYAGLFDGYVKISEAELTRKSNLTQNQVIAELAELDRVEVLSYYSQSDSSRITFLAERLDAKNVIPDTQALLSRRKDAEKRLAVMMDYVTNKTKCRSRILLEYFGETETYRCGICDHCLDRNQLSMSNLEFEMVAGQVKELLQGVPLPMKELVHSVKDIKEDHVVKVVRWLIDNEKIVTGKDQKLSWKA